MSTELVHAGVRLEQYAGVSAALADGLALDEVLAQEQLATVPWADASRAWTSEFSASPELLARYTEKLAIAEDCLRRDIDPLDTDPVSFAGLLAAFAGGGGNPMQVVSGLGLKLTDVNRLVRSWERRASAEPEVKKKLEAATKQRPPPPANVRCAPLVLKPFPWTPKPGIRPDSSAPATSPAASQLDDLAAALAVPVGGVLPAESSIDLWAALQVALELVTDDRAEWLKVCGLDGERWERASAAWRERLRNDASARAQYQVLVADHRLALRQLLAGARGELG